MIPIWGDEKAEGTFLAMAAEQAGVEEKDLISTDLFLYNRMPGTIWGAHGEYISARIWMMYSVPMLRSGLYWKAVTGTASVYAVCLIMRR